MAEKTFKQFLQANLSWNDYENLNFHLGMHSRGVTMLLEDPTRGNKLQKEKIAFLLQKWNSKLSAEYLTEKFKFGLDEVHA
jgi:hypothetical protein